MRYYNIMISDAVTGKLYKQYTSLVNGVTDPNALAIELDIQTTSFAEPFGASYVRLWGIPITDIEQTNNFNPSPGGANYKQIQIYAGMQKGLPLANPSQAGLICQGLIQQAFGNWQGTEMTLDLVIIAGGVINSTQANLILNWPAGTKLSAAIKAALANGFPTYASQIAISDVVLAHDEQGYYGTLIQFAKFLLTLTQGTTTSSTYPGVRIVLKQNMFFVDDATTPKTPVAISFKDLVGQPTWLGVNQISFTCVLRGDLNVFDWVSLPPTQATTTAQSYALYRQSSLFQGSYQITSVRHTGASRDPSGQSWVTTFIANTVG